jgi:hypothetical protein
MIFMILKFRDSVEICLIFVCIHLQFHFLSKMLARNMPPCETTKFAASGLLPRKHRGGTMRLLAAPTEIRESNCTNQIHSNKGLVTESIEFSVIVELFRRHAFATTVGGGTPLLPR